jgi:RND family efflux transporter MFP subunit
MRKFVSVLFMLLWACGGTPEPASTQAEPEEPEPVAVTQWTEKSELFMEYSSLRVGETSRFAIHLTDLQTFKPLTEGRAVVELAYGGGPPETFSEDGPSRPGIFGVNVTPTRAGSPIMTILVESPAVEDEHRLGPVEVTGTDEDEDHDHPHPHDGDDHEHPHDAAEGQGHSHTEEISFLKEQQWTLDFATQVVETATMRESLTVPAKVQARSGGRVAVTAPVGGRLSTSVRLPVIGTNVESGQVVAAIVPPTSTPSDLASLELAADEAQVKLDFARQERERLERLLEAGAIPARRVNEAKANESVVVAQLKAAQARLAQYEETRQAEHREDGRTTFQVRSPLSGVVAKVGTTDGAHVEDGETLLEVVAVDRVYVVGEVPEAAAVTLPRLAGAEVVVPGLEQPMRVGRLVSVANFVDPQSRTVKIIYEMANGNRRLAIGQAILLQLFHSAASEAPAIPESALVDDGGRPIVFVQTGGESFERRPVTLGQRQGGAVQVVSGIAPGERVVTREAYLIRLASMSTQVPAHGHVH